MTINIEKYISRHSFSEAVSAAHRALRRPNPAPAGLFRQDTLPGDHEPFIAALDLRTLATTNMSFATLSQDESVLDDPVYLALYAATDEGRDFWALQYLAGVTYVTNDFKRDPQIMAYWLGTNADERLAAADVIRDDPHLNTGYGPEGHEYRISTIEALALVFEDEAKAAQQRFADELVAREATS